MLGAHLLTVCVCYMDPRIDKYEHANWISNAMDLSERTGSQIELERETEKEEGVVLPNGSCCVWMKVEVWLFHASCSWGRLVLGTVLPVQYLVRLCRIPWDDSLAPGS